VTATFPLFLPCAGGTEALLADEVRALLPAQTVLTMRGGVTLDGDLPTVMRLNLYSRIAQRVLVRVAEAAYRDERDLYAMGRSVDWGTWITPRQSLRVDVTARRSPLRSLNFAALRIKDAVCDAMREATGTRPNVDTRAPDLALVLHLDAARAALYVDTSGEPLFKRGWREEAGEAPLKETLAAALLAAAGWRGTPEAGGALLDPCCGAGTIPIEAAQLACGIAPGLTRHFAFERLAPFAAPARAAQWQTLRRAAQANVHASAVPIFASDVSFRMIDFARGNAQRAGVLDVIEFHAGDALERAAPRLPAGLPGTLIVNPPYGERVAPKGAGRLQRARPPIAPEAPAAPPDFFVRLAAHWKRAFTQHPAGWTAWVLSPNPRLPGTMRLKASRRVPLWNGPIECRLFRFDLVAGSPRDAPSVTVADRGATASGG
jgi:putative N6-adenine-specific DNA methylase